jgi:O-acetyl-ADP-ribose deacetylase (regulator of RNase III)
MKKMIDPAYKKLAEMIEPKLKHAQGNLLDLAEQGKFNVIVQGCNCFNTMGGGIAREIRERFPSAAKVDNATVRGSYHKLGSWTHAIVGAEDSPFTIINAYTQYNMSSGEDVFEYTAFALILQKLAHVFPGERIGFPYIGMGLAGGNKDRIMAMLEQFALQHNLTGGTVTLVEFK